MSKLGLQTSPRIIVVGPSAKRNQMRLKRSLLPIAFIAKSTGFLDPLFGHVWTDKSGHYRVEAEMASGATDLWNVFLIPNSGYGYPYHVLVPGQNSDRARAAATQRYPTYTVAGFAKYSR